MGEDFTTTEIHGLWWHPDTPNNRVGGVLSISSDGRITLRLMGVLQTPLDRFGVSQDKYTFINGLTVDGKAMIVWSLLRTNLSQTSSGTSTSEYIARLAIRGVHLNPADPELKFRALIVHFTNFDAWVNQFGFDLTNAYRRSNEDAGWAIHYKRPDDVPLYKNEQFAASIKFEVKLPAGHIVQTEASFAQRAMLYIEFTNEALLDEVIEIIQRFRNFLTLTTASRVHPVVIKTESDTATISLGGTTHRVEFEVLGLFNRRTEKELLLFQMLLPLPQIRDRITKILGNWFDKYERLEPICNLHFGAIYNTELYLEHTFLSVVQAVESYHRRFMRNESIPPADHKAALNPSTPVAPPRTCLGSRNVSALVTSRHFVNGSLSYAGGFQQ